MKMKKITAWILTIVLIGCLGAVAPVQAQEEPDRTEGYDLMLYGMAEEIWVGDRLTIYGYQNGRGIDPPFEDVFLNLEVLEGSSLVDYQIDSHLSGIYIKCLKPGEVTVLGSIQEKETGREVYAEEFSFSIVEKPEDDSGFYLSCFDLEEACLSDLWVGDQFYISLITDHSNNPAVDNTLGYKADVYFETVSGDGSIYETSGGNIRFIKAGDVRVKITCSIPNTPEKVLDFHVIDKPAEMEVVQVLSLPLKLGPMEKAYDTEERIVALVKNVNYGNQSYISLITDHSNNPAVDNTLGYKADVYFETVSGDGSIYETSGGNIRFIKAGDVRVKITCSIPNTPEKVLDFHVIDKPAEMEVVQVLSLPLKLGPMEKAYDTEERIVALVKNVNYGNQSGRLMVEGFDGNKDWVIGYVEETNKEYFVLAHEGGFAPPSVRNHVMYLTFIHGALNCLDIAKRPGTLPYKYYIEVDGKKALDFPDITIEEPVITNNLPEKVYAGQSLSFSTALTNTYYENELVEDVLAKDDYYHHMGFRPKVEVLEGDVLQSGQDYSNTLTSSETLTFLSPGTVKLKITYESIHFSQNEKWNQVCEEDNCYDGVYSPSTTISFEVLGAPEVAAAVDKDRYEVNETITATITTPDTVKKAYFVSETGMGIASVRNQVHNPDGTITWTHAFSLGSVGDRTLHVYTDGTDTGTTVSFAVRKPAVLALYGATISERVAIQEDFTAVIQTSTHVNKVRLFNENGIGLAPTSCTYVDDNGVRTWTYVTNVGSPGKRRFTVRVSGGDNEWIADEAYLNIQIDR